MAHERTPKDLPWEPEDPMQLKATAVPGNPEAMLAGIVEEYARLGWDQDSIMQLFESPFFNATHRLTEFFGVEETKRRIENTLSQCGVFRVRMTQASHEAEK